MTRLSEQLRNGAADLQHTSDQINSVADYMDKGMKVASFWNPFNDEKRRQDKVETEKWRKKERWLICGFVGLWAVMIVITVLICIYVV